MSLPAASGLGNLTSADLGSSVIQSHCEYWTVIPTRLSLAVIMMPTIWIVGIATNIVMMMVAIMFFWWKGCMWCWFGILHLCILFCWLVKWSSPNLTTMSTSSKNHCWHRSPIVHSPFYPHPPLFEECLSICVLCLSICFLMFEYFCFMFWVFVF